MRVTNWGVGRLAVLGALAAALGAAPPTAGAAATSPARIARVGAAPAGKALSLVLPLKTDKAGLARFATAVSTPGSPAYGQFQSIPTLVRRFGAPAGERARVLHYLRATGATRVKIDGTGLYADATMSVGLAHRLFAADLADFRAATASPARFVAPTSAVRIPAALAGAVTGVVGLDTRPLSSGQSETPKPAPLAPAAGLTTDASSGSAYQPRTGTASGCANGQASGGFTPNQYLTAYGLENLTAAGLDGTGERVALIEINGFRYSDISAFAKCFGLHVPKISRYRVGDVKHPLPPVDGETTLDLEILEAAAPGLKGIDVYEAHPLAADVLHALTVPLQNHGRKPDVISASLGSCESDAKAAIGGKNITTVESALQLAAASGISVLASSGDDGSTSCFGMQGLPEPHQAVSFPASSPWVTGVGGTNITLDGANNLTNQVVWDSQSGAGGGGYSILFKRPNWQNGFTAAKHRVVPDVAMLADTSPGYAIYCTAKGDCQGAPPTGPWGEFGGTSAGTPMLAGGLAVIDEALRKAGRQDIGLANPLFYKIARTPLGPTVFKDVVSGDNDLFALETNGAKKIGCCTSAPGYDAASGLGGVILSNLSAVAGGIVRKLVAVGVALPRQRHPVRDGHLLARVSCSGRCLMGAYAKIKLGEKSRHRLTEYSDVYLLRRRSHKTIRIGLDKPTLRKLRFALHHHEAVTATIYGAVVDPSGNVERRSRGRTLHITG
jgi:subtilase family serine protease